MIPLRKTVSLLTITALLLSNVAGWVHVHEVADGSESSISAPHCCHHDCDATAPFAPENGESQTCDDPTSTPAAPHDSDDCAVCQLIYTIRDAADLSPESATTQIELLPTESGPSPSHVLVVNQWLDGPLTSRGPPVV